MPVNPKAYKRLYIGEGNQVVLPFVCLCVEHVTRRLL